MVNTMTTTKGKSKDGAPSGKISWAIDKDCEISACNYYSPILRVRRIPWCISISKTLVGGKEYMKMNLNEMETGAITWSAVVDATFTVVNKDQSRNIVRQLSKATFDRMRKSWSWPQLIEWDEIIDEEKGFIRNDKISVKVYFKLSNIMGIKRTATVDFANPIEPGRDATLIIEGKKIYVSKQFLSFHSRVFNRMFFNVSADNAENKEFTLDDVVFEDFIETMKMLYSSGGKITDTNFENLLSVGHRFQFNPIIDRVKHFLNTSSKVSLAAKLRLSGDYQLLDLQKTCVDSIKTISDFSELKKTEEYKHLADSTKLAMFEKIMELID